MRGPLLQWNLIKKRYQWCEKGKFDYKRVQMLPVSLLSLPPACRGWWSSSTGQWTKHEKPSTSIGHDRNKRGPGWRDMRLTFNSCSELVTLGTVCSYLFQYGGLSPYQWSRQRSCGPPGSGWGGARPEGSSLWSSPAPGYVIRLPISISISFLLRNRPRKPFTGSMWLAHSTHLGRKSHVDHVSI